MQTDYLIIGHGITGALLSYNLVKKGKKVIVINDVRQYTSSKIASGLINPVTGKRVVKTWLIDDLLPFSLNCYRDIEEHLDTSIVTDIDILDFHTSREAEDIFNGRLAQPTEYLSTCTNENDWLQHFNFHYSIGKIAPCLLIDINSFLDRWQQSLKQSGSFIEEYFEWEHCLVNDNKVIYKDITAEKVICCEGAAGFNNPYFSLLPYSLNKGEVIIASIPGLPRSHIYKNGLKILPWQDGLFWIGSSFEWKYDDLSPTTKFRNQVEAWLSNFLKLPYTIVDHWAAERPASVEYKPFVGMHPLHPSIGIFNGTGAKGCSLAPFFAQQFADHLTDGTSLMPDVDVKRFKRILSKQ